MESIWEKDAPRVKFATLDGNKSTDVLIIGGGIAGILCAYKLKCAGVDCMLAEATEICGGITKNTTAKITLGHSLIYDKTIMRFGERQARLYLASQIKAGKDYAKLCKNIDCDYETADSYVYSLDDPKKIGREVASLNRLGVKAELTGGGELPFSVAGAVRVKDQAQFNPLKFLYVLVVIPDHAFVISLVKMAYSLSLVMPRCCHSSVNSFNASPLPVNPDAFASNSLH